MAHQGQRCCCFLDHSRLASGRHSLAPLFCSLYQPAPPSCCPAEPRGLVASAQLHSGNLFCRQGKCRWPFCLLPAGHTRGAFADSRQLRAGDSPHCGGQGSIYLEVPCPGPPGHNLGTRQCLGHQVPARTWAHCQEWLCWDTLLSVLPPL